MNLEENLKQLEKIAEELEQGGISLDHGIKLYEQAWKREAVFFASAPEFSVEKSSICRLRRGF